MGEAGLGSPFPCHCSSDTLAAAAVTPDRQIPRPGSDGTSSKHGNGCPNVGRSGEVCPETEVQGKSRGSSVAAILGHSRGSSSLSEQSARPRLPRSHVVGLLGELRVLVHQLGLEMLLVGEDVALPLGDCLLLTDPDLLCNLKASAQGEVYSAAFYHFTKAKKLTKIYQ